MQSFSYHDLLTDNFGWADESRKIIKGYVPETVALKFHKKMPKGAALRQLQHQHLHLAYWETKYYKEAISKFLSLPVSKNNIVADIGCGDGRFTEYLIDKGYHQIIATDIDIKPLINLADFLSETGDREKVILIHSGVEKLPLKDNILDAALCIGVLYYLNEDYETGLQEVLRLLKKGGLLINSEPDLEGAIYKSIFFESIDDVYENFFCKKFKEEKGDTPYKFRLFSEEELVDILTKNGQSVVDKVGLSLLPSIVRIMMVRGILDKASLEESEYKMQHIMDYMNEFGKLSKHIIWKSIKVR